MGKLLIRILPFNETLAKSLWQDSHPARQAYLQSGKILSIFVLLVIIQRLKEICVNQESTRSHQSSQSERESVRDYRILRVFQDTLHCVHLVIDLSQDSYNALATEI